MISTRRASSLLVAVLGLTFIECAPPCASGTTECNGACTSTQSDDNNCGACGNVCAHSQVCESGVCGCATGVSLQRRVQAVCLQTDEDNCGSCGNVCGNGFVVRCRWPAFAPEPCVAASAATRRPTPAIVAGAARSARVPTEACTATVSAGCASGISAALHRPLCRTSPHLQPTQACAGTHAPQSQICSRHFLRLHRRELRCAPTERASILPATPTIVARAATRVRLSWRAQQAFCSSDCHQLPGTTRCGQTCRDLVHDANNCGQCNTQCGVFSPCCMGTCSFPGAC